MAWRNLMWIGMHLEKKKNLQTFLRKKDLKWKVVSPKINSQEFHQIFKQFISISAVLFLFLNQSGAGRRQVQTSPRCCQVQSRPLFWVFICDCCRLAFSTITQHGIDERKDIWKSYPENINAGKSIIRGGERGGDKWREVAGWRSCQAAFLTYIYF